MSILIDSTRQFNYSWVMLMIFQQQLTLVMSQRWLVAAVADIASVHAAAPVSAFTVVGAAVVHMCTPLC